MSDTHFWSGLSALKSCSNKLGATGNECLLLVVALYFLAALARQPLCLHDPGDTVAACQNAFRLEPVGDPGRTGTAFFVVEHPLDFNFQQPVLIAP